MRLTGFWRKIGFSDTFLPNAPSVFSEWYFFVEVFFIKLEQDGCSINLRVKDFLTKLPLIFHHLKEYHGIVDGNITLSSLMEAGGISKTSTTLRKEIKEYLDALARFYEEGGEVKRVVEKIDIKEIYYDKSLNGSNMLRRRFRKIPVFRFKSLESTDRLGFMCRICRFCCGRRGKRCV